MDNDYKKEARRQYLHYFRFWFLGIGLAAVACVALWAGKQTRGSAPRANNEAPTERVFDYGEVLTPQEEEALREQIARMEEKIQADIVLMTISQPVEGREAMEQYGLRWEDWERNMQDIADDFWDQNRFGYNKGYEGDGILLLYNWYQGQKGEVLSTSGKVERALSTYDIEEIFDAVDARHDRDPFKAYEAYVDKVGDLLEDSLQIPFGWGMVIFLPIGVAAMYAAAGASQKKADNTVAVNAYVSGGKPEFHDRTDVFLRKSVVTRRIAASTGGGGRSSANHGGGGHHHSSSGASHGGGSRRH